MRPWGVCSLTAALAVTALDAVLLQRTESYFTGGFLSTDHLRSGQEIAGFLTVSLLTDFAVCGLLAGVAMRACHRLRRRAWMTAGLLAAVAPLTLANVVSYELVRYFGDLVDVSLLFELTGRSVQEMFAASAAHLVTPVLGALLAVTGCASLVWLVNRRDTGRRAERPSPAWMAAPLLSLLAAVGIATAASAASPRVENGVSRKPSGQALMVIAERITDFDRDGFGMGGRFPDPNPSDSAVFPHALDIPGNGIDEDGVGGDLHAGTEPYREGRATERWTEHPDVVLVVLESFRFDLLGAMYQGKPVTSVLDALAARGVSSRRAFSHNGYTAQSRYHLLSGSLAGTRGETSLIDDFKANGYFVAYVSGQDESFGGPRYDTGFARADVAIDARSDPERRYTTFTTPGSLAVPFQVVEEHVAEALERDIPADRPLFLYVNFHDTHFPYSHDGVESLTSDVHVARHRIVPEEREAVWAAYVNTAANVDRAVGRVLDAVRRARGVDPAVIVTADHGESLFENGFLGHGHALDDVQTRVPFITANLPLALEEPFGHVELRDAIAAALSGHRPPQPGAMAGGEVFQYLGTINRPRQIALRDRSGLVVYDFRTRQLQVRGGPWKAADAVTGSERADLMRLVQHWERMMLARKGVQDE